MDWTSGFARPLLLLAAPIALTGATPPAAPVTPAPAGAAYLFVYFTENTIDGEKLRFAISDGNNALQWKTLNHGKPMLQSTEGTRGLRDPFIMRSAEGDRFFLLATDLSAARSGWGDATRHGSRYLEIWESTDLIHWGKQRHVRVNLPAAGMTWAPEATYDPTIGAYVVYWTSTLYKDAAHTVEDGEGPQILSAITRDFRTFTTPTPWFKAADVPGSVRAKGMIDATVMKDGDLYYRFTKISDAQGCSSSDILAQVSPSLRADGASGQWTILDRCIGRRAGTPEVEGPTAFVANPGDTSGFKYFLWVDDYGGGGYIPLATNALKAPIAWTYPRDFQLPPSPRHGTVLSITAAERDQIEAHWRSATPDAGDLAARWVMPPVLASGTRLPVPDGFAATWRADGRVVRDGVLTNRGAAARVVRLDGRLTRADGTTLTKSFTVRVLGSGARQLEAYARTPTSAHDANQSTIARSVHLALSGSDGRMTPLNDDYGVVFAKGDYIGVDRVALRGVADPSLFHFADGALGVIATRVDMAGKPDPAATATVIFRSDPARPGDFEELGTLDLRSADAVTQPHAVWDSATRRYLVSWTDRNAQQRWTTVADLTRTEWQAATWQPDNGGRRRRIVSAGNVGDAQIGAVTTHDALAISADIATGLTHRFGRIVNTNATVAPQKIAAGRSADLGSARVTLGYSDGSTATRAVDWDAADLARLMQPGRHLVHGTVRQRSYPAIFAYNRADPDIYRWEKDGRVRYLLTATDDTDNDNVGSVHLPLRVADRLADLADANGGRAREVDLLNRRTRRDRTTEGRVIAGCYWAPEIHEIGGKLSILFAPCFNPKDDQSNEGGAWSRVASHLIQLRDGGDPANPADWSRPAAIRKADGTPLGRAEMPANISLDMSFFTVGKRSYYTWSQRYLPASGTLGDPLTWIAPVDPAHPTRLAGPPTPIIAPQTSVEENLAEGAFALTHNGRLTLVYSSSGVSPKYVVNGISAPLNADLTRIGSWRKWSAPLQKSQSMPAGVTDYRRYEQGPGHGAFTTDEDGNPLYVYHTWGNGVGGDGRDARVRRVHWAADGRLLLDMTRDEEVAPANRRITIVVTTFKQNSVT
ncbi:family 43 glycosylhydrolase [Sphingomonas phyllosphaerae]|uniref:family 43 glycosylhydrolase n=1 Tax=Sphingomonas phyllosphaerae TaxID=257003 RepID=UPI000425AB69|nr:family 43 glycosylhydrolase [Sphingomonas phyllosphaerae]